MNSIVMVFIRKGTEIILKYKCITLIKMADSEKSIQHKSINAVIIQTGNQYPT